MQSQKGFVVVLCALLGLAAMSGTVIAAPTYVGDNLLNGTGVTGIQAVPTSEHGSGLYPAVNAIDGKAGSSGEFDFVFASGNPDQRLVIHGFNNSVGLIRLWTGRDIPPTSITVRSSTTNNASYNDTFETQLVATTALPNTDATWGATPPVYKDFYVNAPTGTKSLLFDFGSGNGLGPEQVGWARIGEVQAMGRMINIDINGKGDAGDAPVTYTGNAAAGGGVWNGYLVDSTAGVGSVIDPPVSGPLKYADGSNSTVKFDLSAASGDAIIHSGNNLMDDYAYGPVGSTSLITFTLKGLAPGGHYSMYLYGKPGAYGGPGTTFTVGNTTLTETNTAGFDGTFVENRDYVKFTDVKADLSGKITGTATVGSIYNIMNGLQLVEGAFTDPTPGENNLLKGRMPVVTSEFVGDGGVLNHPKVCATDGQVGGVYKDFVFASTNPDQRMVIHGFNSAVGLIRLWTSGDIPPLQVTIKSSTSDKSSYDDTFETTLVNNLSLVGDWLADSSGNWYRNFVVNAPAGTQSLFFDFGAGNGAGWTGGARIAEVQAYIPEPSSVVLLVIGLIGLLAYDRRRRR